MKSDRKLQVYLFVLVSFGLLLSLCYMQVPGVYFLSDDYKFLHIMQTQGLGAFLHNFHDSFFIPLAHLYGALLWYVFGFNILGYNMLGLVLHLTNSFLVFLLIKRILSIFKAYSFADVLFLAYFTALLFLISPYQTEAVNWFSSRSYLLALFFLLLFALHYTRFVFDGRNNFLIYSLLFYFLALLSKEIAWVVPVIVFVTEMFFLKSPWKQRIRVLGLFGLLSLFYGLLRYIVLGNIIGGYGAGLHLGFSLIDWWHTFIAYSAKFFMMYRYLPEFMKEMISLVTSGYILSAGFLLLSLLLLWVRFRKKNMQFKILLYATLLFLITLLPVINLETTFLGNLQSDRYGYMVSIPAGFIIVFLVHSFFPKKISVGIMVLLSLLFAILVFQTNKYWVKAGYIAEVITQGVIANSDRDTILFLNLPDNFHGVYVLRVGFEQSIHLHAPDLVNKKYLFVSIQNNLNDKLIREIDTSGNWLHIIAQDSESHFMGFNPNLESQTGGSVSLIDFDREGFRLQILPEGRMLRLLYYDRGSVKVLPYGGAKVKPTPPA